MLNTFLLWPTARLIGLVMQCYFFDSDIGGFHYGPGHPWVLTLPWGYFGLSSILRPAVKDETHSNTDVSFSRYELRLVQEDGDFCEKRFFWLNLTYRNWCLDHPRHLAGETCNKTRNDAIPLRRVHWLPKSHHTKQYEFVCERATQMLVSLRHSLGGYDLLVQITSVMTAPCLMGSLIIVLSRQEGQWVRFCLPLQ